MSRTNWEKRYLVQCLFTGSINLSLQIEIDLYCELTPRQRYLYKALRANSSVAELLRQAANFATDAAATASLMNLVMQFRKVCLMISSEKR